MSSATAWNVRGVGRETRAFAEEAARRAGISLGDWLDEVVADKASEQGVEPDELDRDDRLDAIGERIARMARRGGRPAEEALPRRETRATGDARARREPDRDETRRADELLEAAISRFESRAERTEARAARAFESVAEWIERSQTDRGEERDALRAVADKLAAIDQRTARQQSLLLETPRRLESRIDEAERELDARMSALSRRLETFRAPPPPEPPRRERQQHDRPQQDRFQQDRIQQERRSEEPVAQAPRTERPRIDIRDAASQIARRRDALDARANPPDVEPPKRGWRNFGVDDAAPSAPSPAPGSLSPAREPSRQAASAAASPSSPDALRHEILALTQRIDQMRRDQNERATQPAGDVQALRGEIAAMSRSLADLAPRNAVVALEGAMRDLSERIAALRDNGVRDNLLAPLEGLLGQVRDALRAHDPQAAVAGLQREIRAIETKVDAIGEGVISPAVFERIRLQTEEVRNLLAAAATRPVPVERLEKQIGELADRVERLAANPAPQAESARVVAMLADARAQIERSTPAAALSAIERRLEQLAQRMDQALRQPPAPQSLEQSAIEELARRIDGVRASVDRQPDAGRLEAALRELSQKLDRQAPSGASPEGLAAMLQDLGARIDRRPNATLDLTPLEQALRALGERPIEIDTAPIETLMRDLGARFAAPAAIDMRPFEALLREINQKLDRGAPTAASSGEIAALIGELGARVDQRLAAAIDLRPLEDALHGLSERLDRNPSGNDPALVEQAADLLAARLDRRDHGRLDADALAAQISDIHDRLDSLQAQGPANLGLERKVADLVAELDGTRRALQALPASGVRDNDEIADGLADIRAEQASADKRMQTRLGSLQDILERMVNRLGRVEDEVARVDEANRAGGTGARAQYAEKVEAPSAASAALRDIPDRAPDRFAAPPPLAAPAVRSIEGADFLLEPGAGVRPRLQDADVAPPKSAVNAHIAAARRAAQAAMNEKSGRDRRPPPAEPSESAEGIVAAPSDALALQARAFLAGRRRPLLLGATLLALIATFAIIELRGGGGRPALMQKSDLEAPAKMIAPPDAPKLSASAGVDTSPVGSIAPSKNKAAPADLVASLPVGLPQGLHDAAAAGDVNAQFELGLRLIEGRGVGKDPRTAAQWFEQAAARDLPIAEYRLATLYEKGVGVTRDPQLAMSWYLKAANAGNARAMHNLAVMNAEAATGGKPDYAEAAQWFRKAGQLGVRDSQFNLGILYARGLGTTQDLTQAWVWFSLAAQQGDADAGKKRDEVAAKMDAQALVAAAKALAAFQISTPTPSANEASAPAGGWDAKAGAAQTNAPAAHAGATTL